MVAGAARSPNARIAMKPTPPATTTATAAITSLPFPAFAGATPNVSPVAVRGVGIDVTNAGGGGVRVAVGVGVMKAAAGRGVIRDGGGVGVTGCHGVVGAVRLTGGLTSAGAPASNASSQIDRCRGDANGSS